MLKIISQTESGYDVLVPFALKDQFKEIFKTAKWNPYMKTWLIGNKSRKKFEKFVKTIEESGVVEKIKELESEELLEHEIKKLEKSLADLNLTMKAKTEELKKSNIRNTNFLEIKNIIEEKKIEIEKIAKEIKAKFIEAESNQKDILSWVNEIFNFDELLKQKRELEKWHPEVGASAHGKFDSAQIIINEMRNQLLKCGLDSTALKAIALANYNRFDRDSTLHITKDMILNFHNVEQ